MVRRAAPDVDVTVDGEPADGAVLAQELNRSIRRCKAEPRVQIPRASMELRDREAPVPFLDEPQDGAAGSGQAYVLGQAGR